MHTRNLAAFIALALEEIAATIDASVGAWEKRCAGRRVGETLRR